MKILNKEIKLDEIENMIICTECGKQMNSGFCIESGIEYYCSDECLHKHYTQEEYLEMYDNGYGDTYWTEWEDENYNYNGSVKDVISQLRQEISYQLLDNTICNEVLVDNINMMSELIKEIDDLEDNTPICVKYNPMGCLYYEIEGE